MLDSNGCWVESIAVAQGIQRLVQSQKCTPILDLRGIVFNRIPDGIAKINGLEELYLDENGLTELPEAIGHIEKLRRLSLGRNSIRRLPHSLIERWASLQQIFLGQNQIEELGFVEDEMYCFQQGSIGTNPIPEPISRYWMVRQDALAIPDIMRELIPEKLPADIARQMAHNAIHIFQQAGEPMIYEVLFEGIVIEENGRILWNKHCNRPWLRYVVMALIPSIVRGSLVHRSLWCWNVRKISVADLPEIPHEIQEWEQVEILHES